MKIVFDPSFDHGAWPGPLADRDAAVGEVWVGYGALAGQLETALGLGGPAEPLAVRAAALVGKLRKTKGFWSESAARDPFCTALNLLRRRDELCLHGWRGQAVSKRLAELAKLMEGVLPGMPDRVDAVCAALASRNAGVESIAFVTSSDSDPLKMMPALWRGVIGALEAQGTYIEERGLQDAAAKGNLSDARASGFDPDEDDSSLVLLRPAGVLEAAEHTAAWLASLDDLDGTLVIGADPVLDGALKRYGLPVTGAPARTQDNALLQVLPLVLEAGWAPPDPQRVLELLTLPVSPVEPTLARALADALRETPAVGSDGWRKVIQGKMEEIFGRATRDRNAYPAGAITKRADAVLAWRMSAGLEEPERDAVVEQCGQLKKLVELCGLEELSPAQVKRLVEEATSATLSGAAYPAEAGLASVPQPGAVAGPARRIVWWNFTRKSAPSVGRRPVGAEEQRALAREGIELPDPGGMALSHAERWKRPLRQATESLLLVCPRYSDDGEEQYPHPLWDEIAASLENPDRLSFLETRAAPTKARRKKRKPAVLPRAQTGWKTKKKLTRRRKESPSGVGALIGCSLKWALQYKARLRGGEAAALDDSNRLLGELVHDIIARLLRGGKSAPGEAGKKARKLFDDEGPRLAASFFLPGSDAMRADARRIVGEAARDLFRFLEDAGVFAIHVEEDLETKALAGTFTGRPDLVAGTPTRVIDLKWGGLAFWRDQISAGTAHQLAAYGRILAGKEGALPPGAIFIISRQHMLTSEPDAFPSSVPIPGPNANEVWAAVEKAYKARAKELADGVLESPGPDERNKKQKDQIKPHIGEEDGAMVLPPPCRFCDYGGLCGAGWADG